MVIQVQLPSHWPLMKLSNKERSKKEISLPARALVLGFHGVQQYLSGEGELIDI